MRGDGSLDECRSKAGSEKWLQSGYILKVETVVFPNIGYGLCDKESSENAFSSLMTPI